MYQVPIGDFWTCAETSQSNDFFLVERGGALYHEEILFPCQVQFSVSAGTSTTLFMSAIPDAFGNTPSIVAPDGTITPLTSTGTSYTFTQNGTYTLNGDFTNFKFTGSDGTVDASLTDGAVWNGVFGNVPNFGEELFSNINELSGLPNGLALSSLDRTFTNTSPSGDMSVIDVSAATSARGTFLNSDIDPTDDITGWDVSNVTDMSRMFEGASVFNVDISAWDVSNVTNMARMFQGAAVFDADISSWDTSNVTEMQSMFLSAGTFNQNIGTWNVGNVSNMNSMFEAASSFNQDIGDWDVSSATTMTGMFNDATQFNQDLTGWCVNLISSEPSLFDDGSALQPINQPNWGTCPGQTFDGEFYWTTGGTSMVIKGTMSQAGTVTQPDGSTFTIGPGNWTRTITQKGTYQLPMEHMTALSFADQSLQTFGFSPTFYTGALTTMYRMFYNADRFDNSDISGWDTRNVTNMVEFAKFNSGFNTAIGTWNTSNVTNMFAMFNGASTFNQDLNSWNTSSALDISCMFSNATDMNQVFDNWDTSRVTNMAYTFYRMLDQAVDPQLSSWNTSNVTDMSGLFGSSPLINTSLASWDTSNVGRLGFQGMFRGAQSFNGDISNFTFTESDTLLNNFFNNAFAFNQDISMWDMSNVGDTSEMFQNAKAFNQDISSWEFPPTWDAAPGMFNNATVFNQDISNWCAASIGSIPLDFDRNSAFQGETALQPQWGVCPFPGSGNFTITYFQTSSYLSLKLYFHDRQDGEITGPSGTISAPNGTTIQLTELGTYTLPMGGVERISFRSDANSDDVLFDFDPDFYTGSVTDMQQVFMYNTAFNGDISNWDTSRVERIDQAFLGAAAFNGDISGWDMSQVEIMSDMFYGATAFNTPIGDWNVSKVERMDEMFRTAFAFNQPLLNWDVSNVVNMANMFFFATAFNQYLNPWDVSSVTSSANMANMFRNATAMEGNISNWCVPQFTSPPSNFSFGAAFDGNDALLPTWGVCTPFNGIYLEELVGGVGDLVIGGVGATGETGNIRRPDGTLQSWNAGTFANKFTQLGWYEIENMEGLEGLRFFDNDIFFDDTSETAVFRLSSTMDTSGLTETRQMFREAYLFNGDVSMIDTSNATNMAAMFRNARTFDQDISHFDTTNATNMANMFRDAYTFNRDISKWNTAQVARMTDMFNNAAVFNQDLSTWCVPLIASIPNNFDTDSGFVGQTTRQPPWGGCPTDFTLDTDVVIGTPTGVTPVLYDTVISITTAATTTPAGVAVLSSQWQKSTDSGSTWTDIDGATNVTYTVDANDRNAQIRLVQEYQNGGTSPIRSTTSNVLTVEDTLPPPASGTSIDIDFVSTESQGYYGVVLHQPTNRMWLTPYQSNFVVGIDLDDFTDIISYSVPGSDSYRYGGATILPNNKILYAPFYGDQFAIFDPEATTDAQRWTEFGSFGVGFKFISAVVASLNDTAYAFPYRAQGIYKIDHVNAGLSVAVVTGKNHFGPAVEGPDQRIYMCAGTNDIMGIFDPSDDSFQTMTVPRINGNTNYPQNNGGVYVASNNSVYLSAGHQDAILRMNFDVLDANGNPTVTTIDISSARSGTSATLQLQGKPQLQGDGKIFFPPLGNQVDIVILDPSDDSIAIYPGGHNFGRSIGGNQLPDGKIFVAPSTTDNLVQWWETYQAPGFDVFSPRTNHQT